jgi:sugar/nucleoside kinase (ribokinase family)
MVEVRHTKVIQKTALIIMGKVEDDNIGRMALEECLKNTVKTSTSNSNL